MEYKINHESLGGEEVVLSVGRFWGKPSLLHNGKNVYERASGSNVFQISVANNDPVLISFEPKAFDPFPRIEIAGEHIPVGREIKFYDYLFIALPMLLLFIGGALGGALGFVAASANSRLMRMGTSAIERYGLSLAFALLAAFTWAIFAIAFQLLIGGVE